MKLMTFSKIFLLSFLSTLEVEASNVSLTWVASTSPNIGGYKIFYGTSTGNYTNMIDVGNILTATIPDLPEKTEFFFAAKSYNKDRSLESGFSNETSTITPPDVIVPPSPPLPTFSEVPRGIQIVLTPNKDLVGVTNWKWTLPGSYAISMTNTIFKPVYPTYKLPGTYDVTLEVTIDGVVQSYTQKITVGN